MGRLENARCLVTNVINAEPRYTLIRVKSASVKTVRREKRTCGLKLLRSDIRAERKRLAMPVEEKGYIGVGPEKGRFVSDSKAYAYALERCLHGTEAEIKEFREMLIEWYFSGNWIRSE